MMPEDIQRKMMNEMFLVDFEVMEEKCWNSYLLNDGNILKFRIALIKVYKHPSMRDPRDGNPVYRIVTTPIIQVLSKEEAKKKEKQQ
jgi:hypothetical protein